MDKTQIEQIIALNQAFYEQVAESFSASRSSSWSGWQQLVPHLAGALSDGGSCLDIACGNMRFKDFLDEQFGKAAVEYLGIDSCDNLISDETTYQHCDILTSLIEGKALVQDSRTYNVVVLFGLMHHIPTEELRLQLLQEACDLVSPGGVLAVSFWQFMRDERIATKAQELTAGSDLAFDEGDYLLGWKDTDAVRWCHNFTDDEVFKLVKRLDGAVAEVYHADGKNGNLNFYLVVTKPEA